MRSQILFAALIASHFGGATAGLCEEPRRGAPDHLVPVGPHPEGLSDTYQRLWKRLLTPPEIIPVDHHEGPDPNRMFVKRVLAMVRRPPFDPEESIVLVEGLIRDRREFLLIRTRVSRNIYFSMPENSHVDEEDDEGGEEKQPEEKPKEEPPVQVSRATRPLTWPEPRESRNCG